MLKKRLERGEKAKVANTFALSGKIRGTLDEGEANMELDEGDQS